LRYCGVYVFRDAEGACLYVGSSINMRGRIACHKHRKVYATVEMYLFPQDELRDREEDFVNALHPSLNKAKCITRSNRPSTMNPVREYYPLTLESGSGYWEWVRGDYRIGFRTAAHALAAMPLVKKVLNDDAMELEWQSLKSTNGDGFERSPTPENLFATRLNQV